MDQHAGASFSIEPSQDSFAESDGYAKVMVHRHGQPFGQASVSFETLDGDAVGGGGEAEEVAKALGGLSTKDDE
jgi:hypothetical protein